MVCKTILVDEGNILANPEVEPFFYKFIGNNDLTILQSLPTGDGGMPMEDRLQDTLVNNGWRGSWQLLVLVGINALKRRQKISIPTFTERAILENIVERMVTGLSGKCEPVRTIVIFYDSRHWETPLGKPFHAGEKQRFDLDRFGFLAEEEESEVPSFTQAELTWICEPWPDMAWFVHYFDSMSKNSVSADHDAKRKTLKELADQVRQRVNELADRKISLLEELTQSDVRHLHHSLKSLKEKFGEQISAELEKKVRLNKDTVRELLAELLRDAFAVKPFCESNRLLLIRFLKDDHGDYESGLLELSYLLLSLVEYEFLKFGSAHENLGWRVSIEVEQEQFGQAMAHYGKRLADCMEEVEEYSGQLVYHTPLVKKVRCPEIKSRSVILPAPELKNIVLEAGQWPSVLPGKEKEFQLYMDENERIFEDERKEIISKAESSDILQFQRKTLEKKLEELQHQGVEKNRQLSASPLKGFQTVYTWPAKSKQFDRQVKNLIAAKPSLTGLILLVAGSGLFFLLPFFCLIYKNWRLEGPVMGQVLPLVGFCGLLLVANVSLVWLKKLREVKRIKCNLNDLIVENKTRLKDISRNNRNYLSGICTLSEIYFNIGVIRKVMEQIKQDEQKMKFFSSELQEHRDLKICLKHSGPGNGSLPGCSIGADSQPDISKCEVFFPSFTAHSFLVKKGGAAATEQVSENMPGLKRISFNQDFLFESV